MKNNNESIPEIYNGKSFYYDSNTEPINLKGANQNLGMTCYQRLDMELMHKEYLPYLELCSLLDENGLNPEDEYNRDTMEKRLLQSVVGLLNIMANNTDKYMKIETEYGSETEALTNIHKRIDILNKRISAIPDHREQKKSIITFMYRS